MEYYYGIRLFSTFVLETFLCKFSSSPYVEKSFNFHLNHQQLLQTAECCLESGESPLNDLMNLWIAASDGRRDLVEQFLNGDGGFTANSKDANGYTPIHAAASYGHVGLLRELCGHYGGDINVTDNDGDTPLHHCEQVEVAKVIVEELHGDINIANSEGKTALQVFEEDGEFPELIQYMRLKMNIPQEDNQLDGVDQDQLAQFKDSIRYTLEHEPANDDPESIERRKKLERIIQSDNAEVELENYIRDMVRSQMLGEESKEEPETKRRR